MRLTGKLLGWLNRAFDKDPLAYLGLRLNYAGSMQWQVADGVLTTTVRGGGGIGLTVDLAGYTVGSLATFFQAQTGYSVPFVASSALSGASALRLLEGTGDQAESNGDHLFVYTSPLYGILDAYAVELAAAEDAIAAMPAEMSIPTADGGWLDYLGSYYAVPRQPGEMDGVYGLRIIAEVLRPLGNNLAIEQAIADFTGQTVSIVDVVEYSGEPKFDGAASFNGAYTFLPGTHPIYGLFDAVVGYDLLGGNPPAQEAARLRAIIERLRDAGTQLRSLSLGGSQLSDAITQRPTDDEDTLVIGAPRYFDGTFRFDGGIPFSGPGSVTGTIAGTS